MRCGLERVERNQMDGTIGGPASSWDLVSSFCQYFQAKFPIYARFSLFDPFAEQIDRHDESARGDIIVSSVNPPPDPSAGKQTTTWSPPPIPPTREEFSAISLLR